MDKGTIIRTIAFFVAWANQLLVFLGFEPFPFDGQVVYEVVSVIFTGVASIVTWWKNNFITAKGKNQKRVLERNNLN